MIIFCVCTVLGSHYQPQSRPPSGRPRSGKSTSRPASHGEIISQKEREDLLFEEFIQYQHDDMENGEFARRTNPKKKRQNS